MACTISCRVSTEPPETCTCRGCRGSRHGRAAGNQAVLANIERRRRQTAKRRERKAGYLARRAATGRGVV